MIRNSQRAACQHPVGALCCRLIVEVGPLACAGSGYRPSVCNQHCWHVL
jgi:hypothetical protein